MRKEASGGGEESRPKTRTHAAIDLLETSDPNRVKHIIWALMGVLFVGGILAAWYAYSSNTARKAEAERIKFEADSAIDQVRQAIKLRPNDYDGNLKLIAEKEEAVKPFPLLKAELQSLKADIDAQRKTEIARKQNLDMLVQQEKDLEDPTKLESVRRMIPTLEMVAGGDADQDYKTRVATVKTKLVYNSLKKLSDDAKAKEIAAGADLRAAAAAYDDAIATFRDQFATGLTDKDAIALYKTLVAKSDEIVMQLVTPEYEASVAERDMLSPKEVKTWKKVEANFAMMGREMVLTMDPPVTKDGKPRKVEGLVGLNGWGLDAPWYDIVFNLEFTIVAGKFDLLLRYSPKAPYSTLTFDPADANSGYKYNTPYKITIKIVGSGIQVLQEGMEATKASALEPKVSRIGGVAFQLQPTSKVTISNCTVKVLRPHGGK